MTILTSRPRSGTAMALVNACEQVGLAVNCGPSVSRSSVLVFRWSLRDIRARRAVSLVCERRGVPIINPHVLDKWVQWRRLDAAAVPVPLSRRVRSHDEADEAALTIGYPVVLKPLAGFKSLNIAVAHDEHDLVRSWRPTHRIVQKYLPDGGRCARLLVVGGRVVHAVTRVARDGIRATYDHGRRGKLEPFLLTPECESMAVAACRALELDIAGVDLVLTNDGPMVLEVNHRHVEFGDRALHGAGAVSAIAEYLAERARQAAAVQRRSAGPSKVVRIVTGFPAGARVALLREACDRQGLATEIGGRTVASADGLWFWGLTRRDLEREARRARAMAMPAINGVVLNAWEQRATLFRAGFHVPRSRPVRTLAAAAVECANLGYPVTLRHLREPARRVLRIGTSAELEAAWRDADCWIIEAALYEELPRVRLWIAGDTVCRARRASIDEDGSIRWSRIRAANDVRDVAVGACRTLHLDVGVVDVAIEPGKLSVLRILQRGMWLTELPRARSLDAIGALARTLRRRLENIPATPTYRRAQRSLLVLAARDFQDRGSAARIAYIHALHRELMRQGHRMMCLDDRFDRALVEDADIILQDPLQRFGFRPIGDELDGLLYEHAAGKSHLLRRLPHGTTDKPGMARLAARLGVRTPLVLPFRRVRPADLPVIVKPRNGSLGRGVRLVRTMLELRESRNSRRCAQQFIDAGAGAAVSIRAITVVDTLVAAAVFYNTDAICSNLSQGGRAIALTGSGRHSALTATEARLLEFIGIDPIGREVPAQVTAMAAAIGRQHAAHGVQMLGQDFVVDGAQQWYFLEVNMGFGTAIFNVTDGDGYPASGPGLRHAARILAQAVVHRFGRGEEQPIYAAREA